MNQGQLEDKEEIKEKQNDQEDDAQVEGEKERESESEKETETDDTKHDLIYSSLDQDYLKDEIPAVVVAPDETNVIYILF